MSVDKKQAIKILKEIAVLLQIKGESSFKSRAYTNGARALEDTDESLQELVESGRLSKIKGMGKALVSKLTDLVENERMTYYEELKASLPEGLMDLTRIPGLGPKKIKKLYDELSITSLGELEYACKENRLVILDGFGPKTQTNILKGIEYLRKNQGRHRMNFARQSSRAVVSALEGMEEIKRMDVTGSVRRCKETVKDIDIIVSTTEPQKVMDAFVGLPDVDDVIAHGNTKSSVLLASGIQVDLRCVTDEQYPFTLLHFTGSKEHNTALRRIAKQHDLKLNEYGLFRTDDTSLVCKSEEDIYQSLGLHFVPPPLREDRGEVEKAAEAPFPALVQESDIRGIFHAHTTYSDGAATLKEMGDACIELGYEYIGITDHSRSAFYAQGLSIERVQQQQKEIDALNAEWGETFRIFKGIESDILQDGALDYPEEILESFDFIIASVHSRFKMNKEDMTQRILKAIEHPCTTMLGHPTGRLLLAREPYELDMHYLLDAAAANDVIVEINANPHRLDLDWRLLEYAVNKGVMISINPDAHTIRGLKDVEYGVGIAQKGGLVPAQIFNTRSVFEVAESFKK